MRLLTVGAGTSLLYATETLLLLSGYLGQPWYEGSHLVLLYLVLSCLVVVLEACTFQKKKRKESGSGGGWGARRSGGMSNCTWDILYERKKIYFQF